MYTKHADKDGQNVCYHGFIADNDLINFATGGQFILQMIKIKRTKDECCALGREWGHDHAELCRVPRELTGSVVLV
ncbi:hypothetical protein CH063_12986 [Colletotrichum higginsianum]|uniref:Uncharacterized protein n=1 Tax=Colletotrichum higginsianum (strain IMI 349063) TaxID=759273 RepID=H1VSL7_COLHI|nr:hypothetical protein CH063_12986 [Colletotrichum higginsianum]